MTPFPGMDPYLERSNIWRQVHTTLIVDIQRHLLSILPPQSSNTTIWLCYHQAKDWQGFQMF